MNELNGFELKEINGGNVPVSYYMDDDTIAQNANLMGRWLRFAEKVGEMLAEMYLGSKIK